VDRDLRQLGAGAAGAVDHRDGGGRRPGRRGADTGWLLAGLALLAAGRPARRLAELAALAVVPVAAVAAVSVLAEPVWVARYLLVTLAPLALLAAAGAARVTAVRLLIVVLVLVVTAYPEQRRIRGGYARNSVNFREAARLIERHYRPDDGIVYQGGWSKRAGIEHYLRGRPARPRDLLLYRSAAAVDNLDAVEHTDPVARVRGTARLCWWWGRSRTTRPRASQR
jgi:mannosyltransferase